MPRVKGRNHHPGFSLCRHEFESQFSLSSSWWVSSHTCCTTLSAIKRRLTPLLRVPRRALRDVLESTRNMLGTLLVPELEQITLTEMNMSVRIPRCQWDLDNGIRSIILNASHFTECASGKDQPHVSSTRGSRVVSASGSPSPAVPFTSKHSLLLVFWRLGVQVRF